MGNRRRIYITEFDFKRLEKLIEMLEETEHRDKRHIEVLEKELSQAKVVASKDIPLDVITMNSIVRVKDLTSGEDKTYQIVFPGEADLGKKKVSVLAPIGVALIGYRIEDTIELEAPAGVRKMKVEDIVYQPEAAGDYHL